jgi:glycosyltransferase 2 family protein
LQRTVISEGGTKISIRSLALAIFILLAAGFVGFLLANVGDFMLFLKLVIGAQYRWIILALLLQALTYPATGAVWKIVAHSSNFNLNWKKSSSIALEQLAIDQVVPAGGVAGQTLIARSMINLGMPNWLAIESVLVGILSYHLAYSLVAVTALTLLYISGKLTLLVILVAAGYFTIAGFVTWLTFLVANRKTDKIPEWLRKKKVVSDFLESLNFVSAEKVLSSKLLIQSSFARLIVMLLDALTLYVIMMAIKAPLSLTAAFIGFVVGSLAGSVTFVPGGVGGYEVGSTAILVLLGVSVEAAIAGTVILRGLTLWIPLIPGIYFLKHQMQKS